MARVKAKKKVMGYALFVKPVEGGDYDRQGFLFNNSREASEYREKHYPSAHAWSIQRVRVDATPVSTRMREEDIK